MVLVTIIAIVGAIIIVYGPEWPSGAGGVVMPPTLEPENEIHCGCRFLSRIAQPLLAECLYHKELRTRLAAVEAERDELLKLASDNRYDMRCTTVDEARAVHNAVREYVDEAQSALRVVGMIESLGPCFKIERDSAGYWVHSSKTGRSEIEDRGSLESALTAACEAKKGGG